MNEAKKIYDSYNLLKWMIPIIAKYTRKWRYSLGLRIENRRDDNLEPDNRNNNIGLRVLYGIVKVYHTQPELINEKIYRMCKKIAQFCVRILMVSYYFFMVSSSAMSRKPDLFGEKIC